MAASELSGEFLKERYEINMPNQIKFDKNRCNEYYKKINNTHKTSSHLFLINSYTFDFLNFYCEICLLEKLTNLEIYKIKTILNCNIFCYFCSKNLEIENNLNLCDVEYFKKYVQIEKIKIV